MDDVMKKIRIGTRGSRLALAQARQVQEALQSAYPDHEIELVAIKTTGDKIMDAPLPKIGDKGLFTKEIEKELIAGTIDLAVHSLKDMPTELPAGLMIGAVTRRLDPRDVFISKQGKSLGSLRHGDTVATGSLRRKAQLMAFNPGLTVIDIRGNVETRLTKMKSDPRIQGIILAGAGIERLGMTEAVTEIVPEEIIIPAVGQAALAVEIREHDPLTQELVAVLDHWESRIAVSCERVFLSKLGGGCQVPIAGLARLSDDKLTLTGLVASLDGGEIYRGSLSDGITNFSELGKNLAQKLLDAGAGKILDKIYENI